MAAATSRAASPRRSTPSFSKLLERSADALVDGVRADPQPDCDFLAAVVLVDEQEAVDLPLAQAPQRPRRIVHVSFVFSLAGSHPLHHKSFRAWNDAQTHSLGLV